MADSIAQQVQQRIQKSASRLDEHIMHLLRVLSTAAGADKFLQTTYYILKLLLPGLAQLRSMRTRRLLHDFVKNASDVLLPGDTLITSLDTITGPSGRLGAIEDSARSLAGVISEFRIFTRLWGLLGIYAWARATYGTPPADRMVRAITWGQIGANVGFQWCENVAYLASKGVLRGARFDASKQTGWWLWSCRFWAAHVALEGVRLLRVRQVSARARETTAEKTATNVEEQAEADRAWTRQWTVNAAYAPMTLHYSIEQGLLTEAQLGVVGLIAGSTGLRQIWKQTR